MKIELRKLLNNKMPQDSIKINIEYNTSQKEEVDNLIKYMNRYSKSIFLEDNYIIEEVLYSDIVCFYSENKNNYCKTMKKVYKTKSKLYEIEKMSTNFMRISKNCIVNIEHIKNFDISKTGSIIINLDDNTFKIVSKRKIKDVIYFLDERMLCMDNNKNSPLKLYKLGNFTRNAVEEFEENIVTKHNYLESVNPNLKNNKNT